MSKQSEKGKDSSALHMISVVVVPVKRLDGFKRQLLYLIVGGECLLTNGVFFTEFTLSLFQLL